MKKTIFLFIAITCLQLKVSYSQQVVAINGVYNTDTTINLTNMPTVYSLTISGQILLNTHLSLVRVVMIDEAGEKYLIYEGSKMLRNSLNITLNNQSEETYYLNNRKPVAIQIHIKNAQLTLNNIQMDIVANNNKSANYNSYLNNLFSQKLANVNSYITSNQLQWIAGDNPVARYTYSQKLNMFGGTMPDLQGFEYYKGGVFERLPKATTTVAPSNVVNSFDWRNRHGQDWITAPKDQGTCNSCAIFAPTGAVEALVNLYYNQHINVNLSEQNLASCVTGSCYIGWPASYVLDYYTNTGVVNEACFWYYPYWGGQPCTNICSNPTERIKIGGRIDFYAQLCTEPEDSLKKMLITHGPISAALASWIHAMTLVGFKTRISDNSTIWIFKNSFDTTWGDGGFAEVAGINISDFYYTSALKTPIQSLQYTDADRVCVDNDGDGYYNWGIGTKPATCPLSSSNLEDCDDSNPNLGPYDEMYNCSIICNGNLYSPSYENQITQNETWNTIKHFNTDITINEFATLTIKAVVNMGEGTKIIVKPGGKLFIDGGKITNLCGKMWQGIEVWGTSNMPQEDAFYSPNQGIVQIFGGTIENADNAITLWHPGDWSSMGGIVDAQGATFLNNRRSIEFMAYQNIDPINGITSRNISQFTKCTFKIDDNYRGGSGNPFSNHVTLWGVNGVIFEACTFLNEQTNKEYSTSNNKAIGSLDAGYTIRGYCPYIYVYGQSCDANAIQPSVFKGFNTAVDAKGLSSNYVVKIENAKFDENVRGVQYDAMDFSWVNKSEFKIGNNSIVCPPDFIHEGITTIDSKSYRIEENKLLLSAYPVADNIGIRNRNSKEIDNQVYKNESYNLAVGERAEGKNKDPNNNFIGLQYLCNKHTNNTNDLSIEALSGVNNGIRYYQGVPGTPTTPSISAGNEFSHTGNDIENASGSLIEYYYTSGAAQPIDYSSLVNIVEANYRNTCSSFANFEPLSAITMAEISSNYTTDEAAYLNLTYIYKNLINGGNTNLLLNKIEMSWNKDAWEIRAELLSKSPYLTEDILREMAMKGILPQAMILEICLANPEATRNEEFIKFLGEKIPNPLPQYMIDLIIDNWDVKTFRSTLESKMGCLSAKMAFASNLLITNYLSDTIPQLNYARNWQTRRGSLPDYYSLAASYIETNNFTTASAYVNQVHNLFRLTEEQEAEHQNFADYVELRANFAAQGKNIMQLKGSDIEALQQIANNNTGRASVLAQNILCFGYQLCAEYLPVEGEGGKLKFSKPNKTAKEVVSAAYNKITATPNPANVYVAFTWALPLLTGNAELIITDINGKPIEQHTITTKQGQWIWDCRSIKNGIYLYKMINENQSIIGNGKIVINN